MDKLNALQFVIAVNETGSFAGAAKKLGLSPSSVSKSITQLEDELGFKIYNRNTRNLSTTNQGVKYIRLAKIILAELNELENDLRNSKDDLSGNITINVPIDYGMLYIQPFLTEFLQMHPSIEIEIAFEDSYVNPIERKADLLIRTGTITNTNMVARKISPMDFLICASPKYIATHGHPQTSENLPRHKWIRFRLKNSGRLMPIMLAKDGNYEHIEPNSSFVCDCGVALANMCADGLGISQMPHFLAREYILSGKLVALFPSHCPPNYGVYVLYNDRKNLPLRCRVLIDALIQFVEARNEFQDITWASGLANR